MNFLYFQKGTWRN